MTKANYLNLIARAEMPDQLRGLSRDASTDPQLFSTDKDEIAAAIQKRFAEINGRKGAWALVAVLILSLFQTVAMGQVVTSQRLAALSMLESGDNDQAIGRAGEVSRFQAKPDVWRSYASHDHVTLDPRNPFTAWKVAATIMQDRCSAFENRFHRPPTDQEFYILWARPSWVGLPRQCLQAKSVMARAQRFSNLCHRFNDSTF